MTRRIFLCWVSVFPLLVSSAAMAELAEFVPWTDGGDVVLFDAGRGEMNGLRTYTASWKKGGDLRPTATRVSEGSEAWIEFTFQGRQGMACSTFYFDKLPDPKTGMQYRGIQFVLDCDRDDYPHIGVTVVFSDQSTLSHDLTLEQGQHEYLVDRGFRRERHPPRWDLLRYVMLTLDAGRHTTDVTYRLQRMTMRQVPVDANQAPTDGRVPDLFAEAVISPRPKQLDWKQGEFPAREAVTLWLDKAASERTRRTAGIFAERFHGFTGQRLTKATLDPETPAAGIALRLADAATSQAAETSLPAQGYSLTVEPDRVVITGADEPGLYYGEVTFFQLLRHALKKPSAEIPVPCVQIRDWPDTLNRMVRLEHPHTFRNYAVRENRGIDYLIVWTDRFVAGNKFNTLYIDLSANVRYERRPEFNGSEKIYSLDDLRRFGQFCRDHFVDLCPAWQIGGHANWWLTIGYHPELREKGWPSQGDVTHPDHDPIVYDCMLDVIEALQPKYVSPKSDEWWHERRADETFDELLNGKPRAQAFLDSHTKLNDWLHERGITMMIYEDMLSPYHNGNPSRDDSGHEVHELKVAEVTRLQEAFVRKVIDTVGVLDNVLWEIGNECHAGSAERQYHLIRFVKQYESTRPQGKHPVGMTGAPIGTKDLLASPADWISPPGKPWLTDPPANDGRKVILVDNDHSDPWYHDPDWVWKNLFRGNQFILMDGYVDFRIGSPDKPDPKWDVTRQAMGRARRLAERVGLTGLAPNARLASTGFCLASPVKSDGTFRCAVYLPKGGEATVDLTTVNGPLATEWIEAKTGESRLAATVKGGSRQRFVAPFTGPAILRLTGKPKER